jgi:chromosome segregation protein
MYLEKIDIQGFKSFAAPTTLVFNKELTAIVGPNGSGKSNVADAIRWVLGEQSLKLLRGKKSDDVIFAGSDSKARLGFAKVVLYLQNQERAAGIDYEQVVIERSIDRSGESNYLLNGNPVRLTDVQLLLAKAHVGQKSYSVIGQGMIDQLLTFSAQDRKDFFDEATGVKQYQIKKTQAIHKLEQTEENLHQAELVLAELEPRLRTLSRQVKRLERKEDLERQLTELHTQYYGFLVSHLNHDLENVQKNLNHEQNILDTLATSERELQKKLEGFELESGRNENYNTLQSRLFHAQQDYNALTKKKIVLEGQKDLDLIKSGNAGEVMLRDRLEAVRRKSATLTTRDAELTREITKIESHIESIRRMHTKTGAELKTIEAKLGERTTERSWEALEKEAHTIHAEHQTIHAHVEKLSSTDDLAAFKDRFKRFAEKLQQFLQSIRGTKTTDYHDQWARYRQLNDEYQQHAADLHQAELELSVKKNERAVLATQRQDFEREEKELSNEVGSRNTSTSAEELSTLEQELAAKEAEIKTLRADIDNFNTLEEQKKNELLAVQKKLRTVQFDASVKNNEVTTLKVEFAKLETRKEELDRELAQEAPGIEIQSIHSLNVETAREQIETIKKQLNIIGGIDTETVKEYSEVHEKHTFLTQQTTDLRAAEKSLIELIAELDEHINTQFQHAFKNINTLFTKFFKRLFNGGTAKLMLEIQAPKEDADETIEDGSGEATDEDVKKKTGPRIKNRRFDYTIEIQATPPGKKLASINMLSGGEKAMTAIALICSIIANNPPPFVVLDEVDAALDEANSIRFAEIISELLDKSQFITITHNRATMHQAKILYGVTMGEDGISRLLSVNFDQADKLSA